MDAADGARLALEQAGNRAGELEVVAEVLDDAGESVRWDPVAVGDNARTASQDSSTAAYIGELESEPTRASAPITNEAGIVQISPGAGGVDLTRAAEGYPDSPDRYRPSGEVSFARVVAADDVVAEAAAELASERGSRRAIAVSGGDAFGDLSAGEFTRAAEGAGIEVVAEGDADTIFYGGAAEGVKQLQRATATANERLVLATDAFAPELASLPIAGERLFTAAALAPERLPDGEFAAIFREGYARDPGPYAAYGYEAMELALLGIERAEGAGEFRPAVRDAVLGAEREDSILGPYSITDDGDTTLCAVQRYRVEGVATVAENAPCAGG
ncbi:MAG: hypothetical protein M3O25_07040 [Actinomycetota bacterium]|nr:hypothetical protein [Actinomycetota bacterium]